MEAANNLKCFPLISRVWDFKISGAGRLPLQTYTKIANGALARCATNDVQYCRYSFLSYTT